MPLGAFHRRRSGDENRRAACKGCAAKAAIYRNTNPPLISQIIRHHVDPSAPLSPEAEASIYSTDPIDPVLLKQYQDRREKREKEDARRLRKLEREAKRNPLSYAGRCYARMIKE